MDGNWSVSGTFLCYDNGPLACFQALSQMVLPFTYGTIKCAGWALSLMLITEIVFQSGAASVDPRHRLSRTRDQLLFIRRLLNTKTPR